MFDEQDHPTPAWWRAVFWATVVFGAGYVVWFHVGHWSPGPEATYRAALAGYESRRAQLEADEAAEVDETALAFDEGDLQVVTRGADVFAARCASCHGASGRGLIGPNLTDSYQIHGTTRMDILATVRSGVPGTAMPGWWDQLSDQDLVAASVFVATLRGKSLGGGKPPQGARVKPFE